MSGKLNTGILVFLIVILSTVAVLAGGRSNDNIWQQIDDANLSKRPIKRVTIPDSYSTFRLNKVALETILTTAPQEMYTIGENSDIILTLPMPDGTFQRFAIKESPIMEAELAAKFPEIKTYLGQGIDNPTATARFDTTQHGFHAMILSDQGTVYVDPYAVSDTQNYISYYKSFANKEGDSFVCHFDEQEQPIDFSNEYGQKYFDTPNIVVNGGTLRTYRLALAATGEYTKLCREPELSRMEWRQ